MESFPPMRGARPIRNPVNRENVTRDVEGQRRVYDIISVLPLQRYGTQEGLGERVAKARRLDPSARSRTSGANSHKIVARDALDSLKDRISQTGNPASVLRVRHWI